MLLLSLILPALLYAGESDSESITPWEINQARFLVSDERTPPNLSDDQWQNVQLTHDWGQSLTGYGGFGWYRIHVSIDALEHHLWAIYLPKLSMNAAVWLNGHLIGSGGSFDEPMSRNWHRPLMFSMPAYMLKKGANVVDVRIKAYPDNGGGLSPLYIAPEEKLAEIYDRQMLINIESLKVIFFLMAWLAMMTMLLWYLRRKDTLYGWFSLACLIVCLYIVNFFVRDIPVGRDLWEWLHHLSMDAFVASIIMFLHRWTGLKRKLFEQAMWVWVISSYLFMLIQSNTDIHDYQYIHVGTVLGVLYFLSVILSYWRERRELVYLVMLFAFGACAAMGINDWYIALNHYAYKYPYLMPYGAPIMMIVVAIFLMVHFAQLQRRAERFSIELKEKVVETTERLNAEHEVVRKLEHENLICDERERMMQDLHDGLGGQLVSALSQVNNAQASGQHLKQTISDALLDLRLVIDSLDEDNRDLATMLGMLRMRLEPQLKASGIKLGWNLIGDSELDGFGHETSLHLLRIVQEAITNAIRHANCSEIQMTIDSHDGEVCIAVADNGIGIGDARAGRGTGNMRRRAEKIGAQLTIDSSESGVKVQIRLLSGREASASAQQGSPL